MREAGTQEDVLRWPDVLVLHLVRLVWDWQPKKITRHIAFPMQLSLKVRHPFVPFAPEDVHENKADAPATCPSTLQSVVVHAGGATSGHFYTYKRVQQAWVRASDEMVQGCEEQEVLGAQAYILFYSKDK